VQKLPLGHNFHVYLTSLPAGDCDKVENNKEASSSPTKITF